MKVRMKKMKVKKKHKDVISYHNLLQRFKHQIFGTRSKIDLHHFHTRSPVIAGEQDGWICSYFKIWRNDHTIPLLHVVRRKTSVLCSLNKREGRRVNFVTEIPI